MSIVAAAATSGVSAAPTPSIAPSPSEGAGAQPKAPSSERGPRLLERLWGLRRLYVDEDATVVQELALSGRFHLDYAWIPEANFNTWNVRRLRVGGKVRFLRTLILHAELDVAQDDDPDFDRLTDGYIAWSRGAALEVTIGKQSAPFTMDGSTSSNRLLTIDRSNLANNLWFTEEYFPGVSIAGAPDRWVYRLGVYASGNTSWFNGSSFLLATIGYDLADVFEAEKALLAFDYVYNDLHRGQTFTRDLGQVYSLHLELSEGRWGARFDVSGALGGLEQSNLLGASVLSYYDFTEQFQAVARYTWVESSRDNGVRFSRYESRIVDGRGNVYHEAYIGLNYYVYGDRLKLQTGVDFADMRDAAGDGGAYRGWAWTTGLRVSW